MHLENNGVDAELVALALKDQPYSVEITVVDEEKEFCKKLDTDQFDVILMDYDVPGIGATKAINIIKEKKITAPIIIISGAIGYQTAIQLIKQGAFDYLLKQNLVGLANAIQRALTSQDADKAVPAQNEMSEVLKVTRTGIFRVDANANCLSMNEPLCHMLGYSKEELGDEGWLKCFLPEEKAAFLKVFLVHLQNKLPFEMEAKLLTKDAQELWVRCSCIPEVSDNKVEYIGAIVDISNLKKTEHELINLSMHDALTGLPNRRYFSELVEAMIYECKRGVLNAFAVFYVDLDFFKKVNDVLGHQNGDELLKQAAARFKSAIRKSDIIARIGGDEFLVVFKHINSVGEVAFLADNLLNKFRVPFYVGEHECLTTLSIGIAYVHEPILNVDAESIIQKADQALYRAKARGRNCYEIYTDKISHDILHTAFIENALKHAIEKNELSIVFQPQIDLMKSSIFGFEVLLRWKQPVYGDIAPSLFIPIAEESGQINLIGEWVVDAALDAFEHFSHNIAYFNNHLVSFSVNISSKQLLEENFIESALKKIAIKKIDYSRIIFELTETSLLQNREQLKNQFNRPASNELCIAVDDFGTGYSSFTHLKELPIKVIKIDQSFVQCIETDVNCKNIIKSIISLARAMDIILIAEGIETKEQADFLYESGCYILQGFYFSRPLRIDDLEDYVKNFKL